LKKVLQKLFRRIHNYFHPSFRESIRVAGISEDIRTSPTELENLKRMLEEYIQENEIT